MKRLLKKAMQLKRNRKQLGEMVLVVSMIYTYLLFNNVIKGYHENTSTAGTDH